MVQRSFLSSIGHFGDVGHLGLNVVNRSLLYQNTFLAVTDRELSLMIEYKLEWIACKQCYIVNNTKYIVLTVPIYI